jgi:hypothetical protein
MDKFIEFNGAVFNTRHIIAACKCKRDWGPQYGIALHVTGDIERQYFNEEYERDTIFNQLSNQLLNM